MALPCRVVVGGDLGGGFKEAAGIRLALCVFFFWFFFGFFWGSVDGGRR